MGLRGSDGPFLLFFHCPTSCKMECGRPNTTFSPMGYLYKMCWLCIKTGFQLYWLLGSTLMAWECSQLSCYLIPINKWITMPHSLGGGIKRWCCLTSVVYIGFKSRTERPRKSKIGTKLAHVTHDSDTTFKVRRSKVKVTGVSGILWQPRPTACYNKFDSMSSGVRIN